MRSSRGSGCGEWARCITWHSRCHTGFPQRQLGVSSKTRRCPARNTMTSDLDGDPLSLDREDPMTGGRVRNRQRSNRRRKAVRTPGRHIQALRNRSGCSAGVRSRLARCRTRPHAPRATNRCGRRRSGHTVRPSRGERQGTAGKIARRSPRNEPTHSSLPTSTATVPAPNAGVSAWRTISRTRSVFGSTFTTMDAPPP